jgi:hypothetical protein
MKYLENLNSEIPHWVVILNETVASVDGSNTKKNWSIGTSQSAWKWASATNTGILLCMLEHETDFLWGGGVI